MQNVVLIGAGRAAVVMLDHFLCDSEIKVQCVVDLNDSAPAMIRAKELGIETSSDMEKTVSDRQVDVVVELTGNAKVRDKVLSTLRADQQLVTAGGAKIMCDIIGTAQKRASDISEQLSGLVGQMDEALGAVEGSLGDIENVLREIRMLALNGNVEAARAGAAGAGFAIVVGRMGDLVNQVQNAVDGISSFSQNGQNVVRAMEETQAQLQATAGD